MTTTTTSQKTKINVPLQKASRSGRLYFDAERYNTSSSSPPAPKLDVYYKLKNDVKLVKSIFEFQGLQPARSSLDEYNWNIFWSSGHIKAAFVSSLQLHQRVNHFAHSTQLTRKDKLTTNLAAMQMKHGHHLFGFIPTSYVLPQQLAAFNKHLGTDNDGPWIVKPNASSRGRGIFLVKNCEELSKFKTRNMTVSKYIINPFLIQRKKFDLRLYVVVTSFEPLRVYLHDEGLARFATQPYEEDLGTLKDHFMHLTNYSVNKNHADYVQNTHPNEDNVGHKWGLSGLFQHLQKMDVDTDALLARIQEIVILAILAAKPKIGIAGGVKSLTNRCCFELYGFDVLIDKDLKPWLLEVNLSPSLTCDSPLDLKIKTKVVCDLLNMISLTIPERNQEPPSDTEAKAGEQAELLDICHDEYTNRGGYNIIFPAADWAKYGEFLGPNTEYYQLIVDRLLKPKRTPRSTLKINTKMTGVPSPPKTATPTQIPTTPPFEHATRSVRTYPVLRDNYVTPITPTQLARSPTYNPFSNIDTTANNMGDATTTQTNIHMRDIGDNTQFSTAHRRNDNKERIQAQLNKDIHGSTVYDHLSESGKDKALHVIQKNDTTSFLNLLDEYAQKSSNQRPPLAGNGRASSCSSSSSLSLLTPFSSFAESSTPSLSSTLNGINLTNIHAREIFAMYLKRTSEKLAASISSLRPCTTTNINKLPLEVVQLVEDFLAHERQVKKLMTNRGEEQDKGNRPASSPELLLKLNTYIAKFNTDTKALQVKMHKKGMPHESTASWAYFKQLLRQTPDDELLALVKRISEKREEKTLNSLRTSVM